MYDKKLFEKICNVTCSFEELEPFVIDINKKEFDLDNPFEKYYDLQTILLAIHRYEKGEVSDRYLAYWMNAYNWIIMGGFKIETENNSITFKEWLEWEICDWLDSLSFFDETKEWFKLDKYKKAFTVLSKVYCNIKGWNSVFSEEEGSYNEDDVVVLAYNDKTKEFVKIYGQLDYYCLDVEFPKIECNELENQMKELKEKGYQQLKYGAWEEENY